MSSVQKKTFPDPSFIDPETPGLTLRHTRKRYESSVFDEFDNHHVLVRYPGSNG